MENYNFIPKDYKRGKTKYIVVTGSVMSGVGKGIFTASLANLFMFYGLKVNLMKFDGYLNVDAGTLNPYRHGEVFVLEDGTETDLDLGSYERALHRNLTKNNYLTSGKIFDIIIKKERKGHYLGRDVQFIPHVTGEIKLFIRNLSLEDKPDILIIEVGGTVGDLENSYFIEAMRELKYEEKNENVLFVNVAYIINSQGEQKSKASQHGISRLMSLGIIPDIIICRNEKPVNDSIKEKLSLVSNVNKENVISFHDLSSIYSGSIYLKEQSLDKKIFKILNINPKLKKDFYKRWIKFLSGINNSKKEIEIAITGKYTNNKDAYLSILKSLEHVSALFRCKIKIKWVETTFIKNEEGVKKILENINGVIVPGGFGPRGAEGKIKCIEYCRKNNIPFLGLCFGFQLAVVEYARNICKIKNANSTEIEKTRNPVINLLEEQKNIKIMGGTMRLGAHEILIKKPSMVFDIYKKNLIKERFRHRYEVNPEYIKILEDHGIIFTGVSKENKEIMQILEIPRQKFFLATQFHPEFTSRPLNPNPIFIRFIQNCLD